MWLARVTRLSMKLTDGTPVQFTSCHQCDHRTWETEGAELTRDHVLADQEAGLTPSRSRDPARPVPRLAVWATCPTSSRPTTYAASCLEQLDEQVAWAVGAAFADLGRRTASSSGTTCGPRPRTWSRPSPTESRRADADVTLIGLCSTDGLCFATGRLDRPGAMFTASHNPAQYNGIKMCRAGANTVGADTGLGDVRRGAERYLAEEAGGGRGGTVTRRTCSRRTPGTCARLVDLDSIRPLKIVVDAGNGMAGLAAPAVLGTAAGLPALPLEVVPLYFGLDGTFPNHEANPLDPRTWSTCRRRCATHGADAGLAFDGDADRCFVVDERGEPVSPSAVTALIARREIARERAGAAGDGAPQPDQLARSAGDHRRAGWHRVRTRVGHSYIKAEMASRAAVFGGEHSATTTSASFWNADRDARGAARAGRARRARRNRSAGCVATTSGMSPPARSTPGGRTASAAVAGCARRTPTSSSTSCDGLTVSHRPVDAGDPSWWFNLRGSNTEPLLRLNVEAADAATMERVRDAVLALCPDRRPGSEEATR